MSDQPDDKSIAASESALPVEVGSGPDDFVPRYFEPERVRMYRSPMGAARLEVLDEVCYARVSVRQILPLSDPGHYISIWTGDDAEVGIVLDPSDLDEESQRVIAEELDVRYFTPVITKIHSVKERFGVHEWDVDTSRGRVSFSVRGLHQNVKQL
ncbi:DUF1854 domain-containing protein, partial [Candidatus Poribacteria bacterium]|nr:DUF1854 domain-containing protein [Candidatus Poribacteria bacterium]